MYSDTKNFKQYKKLSERNYPDTLIKPRVLKVNF